MTGWYARLALYFGFRGLMCYLCQALNVNICEEGDPILTCWAKSEFFVLGKYALAANKIAWVIAELVTVLLTLTRAAITVNIGPSSVFYLTRATD